MPKLARNTPSARRRSTINMKVLPEIRAAIEDAAEANGRPMSAEIEARLLASVEQPRAEDSLRTLIREEIRAALAERDEAHEDRCFGPQPEVIERYRY